MFDMFHYIYGFYLIEIRFRIQKLKKFIQKKNMIV